MNEKQEREDLMECLLRLMRLIRRYPGRSGHHSHSDNKLMRLLARHGGLSSRKIAEMLDIRPASLSERLNRLEERGEIEKVKDENDSRVFKIYLTEEGLDVARRNEEAVRRTNEELSASLSDEERAMFCRLCNKLSEHLANAAEGACEPAQADGRNREEEDAHGGERKNA